MHIYVLETFVRDDENLEYSSAVYTDKEEAVAHASDLVASNLVLYGNIREDEPTEEIPCYCCLDSDPDNKNTYAHYMVIMVKRHDILSKYRKEGTNNG